jgi:PTH1 family peptidyl-tRNA hydrolase
LLLIVGLGNPGKRYEHTRHNIGFMLIDRIASVYGIKVETEGFKSLWGVGKIVGSDVVLSKPQTFVNRSGEAIKEITDYFKVPIENLLVLYDDIDLEFGRISIRRSGGSGGHRGMESILMQVGTFMLPRVRFGIGRPEDGDVSGYVLSVFTGDEELMLSSMLDRAKDAVELIQIKGIEEAMNRFN